MERRPLQWKKGKILGAGSYGRVYLASPADFSSPSPPLAAVKSADINLSETLQKERMFLYELRGEPNIIHCFGNDISTEKDERVYNLLLEYAPGGSLHDLIKKNKGTIPESHVACYTYMILKGLYAMLECEIIHCDLKPGNILVFPNADDNNGIHQLKIADFGLAKKEWDTELHEWGRMGYNNRCTPIYASPESLACGCKAAGDIWSLGCIVVEMITGEPVWSCRTIGELVSKILYEKPKIPENLCEEGKDFLARCFEATVPKRWTAEELLDHPFIVKNLKFLDDGSRLSSGQCYQMNPFGFVDSVSTLDLFSTSSLEPQCSPFESWCRVTDNETEESRPSCCLPSESFKLEEKLKNIHVF
ncbi:mitogen-activated protein kinase kinase kinase 20-like [Coffea arabica]|uniref:Mitogen-activated protein kinase kinase kinase 20-like n=1 Tax=Coffea arabica TaxID=13443 RepID=A0ABM4WQE0_COFAR